MAIIMTLSQASHRDSCTGGASRIYIAVDALLFQPYNNVPYLGTSKFALALHQKLKHDPESEIVCQLGRTPPAGATSK